MQEKVFYFELDEFLTEVVLIRKKLQSHFYL